MMPQSVPVQPPPVTTGGEPPTIGGSSGSPTPSLGSPGEIAGPAITSSSLVGATAQQTVEISFSADRNQLFTAWNAIANLADLAGKVTVTVRAESVEGFDKNKLQNGVIEPLRESDLIK
jgi:hypothetical protein